MPSDAAAVQKDTVVEKDIVQKLVEQKLVIRRLVLVLEFPRRVLVKAAIPARRSPRREQLSLKLPLEHQT